MKEYLDQKIETFIEDATKNELLPSVIEISKIVMNCNDKDIKKYKKNYKNLGIGNFVKDDYLFKYFQLQNQVVKKLIEKEKSRSWEFLNNKKESQRYGFINENDYKLGGSKYGEKIPKQTPQMIEEWAQMAYPNIAYEEWEKNFNILMMRGYLSNS